VVINQIDPIYVAFSVPERNLAEIQRRFAAGSLTVWADVDHVGEDPVRGELTFLDNTVDRGTGTVRLKATFVNDRRLLWPGQFVPVRVHLTTQPDALLVPSQAIQTGQSGSFVFVVKEDGTVESRSVRTGASVDGQTVLTEGVQAGETVVTDGQLRLVPGAAVAVRSGLDPSAGPEGSR